MTEGIHSRNAHEPSFVFGLAALQCCQGWRGAVSPHCSPDGCDGHGFLASKLCSVSWAELKVQVALPLLYTSIIAFFFSVSLLSYSIGTEDGTVHQCSCSYSDSFLTTTKAHSGPVYQLALSPFDSDVMLSCSSDWRLCLWHAKSGPGAAPFVLQPGTSAVMDAAWSKQHPTVLASIR